MITVKVEIEIKHPPAKTFAFISNFENNPKWQEGMQKCTVVTPGDLQVGTQYNQEAKFLGKDIISTFEVTDYTPGQMVKAKSITGPFPITFKRMVENNNGISKVRAIIEGESKGFFRIAQPLMRWMVNRSIQKDYQRLKKLLESAS
ncbi:MAG: SRPBCC family protein [Cyclobacteriaceae bacterium]